MIALAERKWEGCQENLIFIFYLKLNYNSVPQAGDHNKIKLEVVVERINYSYS